VVLHIGVPRRGNAVLEWSAMPGRLTTALVADDNRVTRMMIAEVLREHGASVVEAATGREAFDQALASRPELLVLDGLLPLMSGFDVITKLRDKVHEYKPAIFIATGVYKGRRWASQARTEYGVVEFLEKPFGADTLIAALRRHFDLSR
jgi:CheY-like chemotaxis protein